MVVRSCATVGQVASEEILYTYDANGNLTSRTKSTCSPCPDTYFYDAENRLVAANLEIDGPARHTSYTYDPDGIRNSVTVNGVTTYHLTDKNRPYAQVLAEHDGDGAISVRYTYGDDLISQTRDPLGGTPVTSYYHYDGQMSTRQLTDDADPVVITDQYTFDAFGNLLDKSGSTPNDYLYTGEQYDPNIGFYYLRARYYAQEIGRFVTRDPFPGNAFDPASLHKYMYAHGNPADNMDPSGRRTIGQVVIGLVIVSVLVYMAYSSCHSYRASKAHTATIRVSVDSANLPSSWNTPRIHAKLQEAMKPVYDRLSPSHHLAIQIVEEPNPPSKLGWTWRHGQKTLYNGRVRFGGGQISGIAAVGGHQVQVSERGIEGFAFRVGAKVDWDWAWANVIAHEIIWKGACWKRDSLLPLEAGDIRGGVLIVDGPVLITPDAAETIIEELGLKSKGG